MNRRSRTGFALLAGLLVAGPCLAAPRQVPQWKDPNGPPVEAEIWLDRLVGRYMVDGVVEVVYYEDHRCGGLPPDPAQFEDPPPPTIPYCESVQGMGDCAAIGTGPGVQCIFNVQWRDVQEVRSPTTGDTALTDRAGVFNVPGGTSNLAPSMALFGLDPASGGIGYLMVDSKSLADGDKGTQLGNRATFRMPCVNAAALLANMYPDRIDNRPPQTCEKTIRIDARPDARSVFLSVDFEVNDETFTRYEFTLRRIEPATMTELR